MKIPAALFVSLLLAVPLSAQPAPERLSLEDAVRLAEANNPSLRRDYAGLRMAEARERQARGSFLPSVSASLSLEGSANRRWVGSDPYGNPIAASKAVESTSSTGSQSVDVSIPVFQRARFAEVAAAADERRAAGELVRAQGSEVRGEVMRRYYDALRLGRTAALEERLLTSARERLDATRRLFQIAAQGAAEVLGGEVEVARQERAVHEAHAETRKAKLLLGESIGSLEVEDAVLTSDLPPIFDPSRIRVDSLVAFSLGGHPLVVEAALQRGAAVHRVAAARGQRWPSIDARLGLRRAVFGQDREGVTILDPSARADQNLSLGFAVSLPVFDQLRTSAQTAQAAAALTRAQEAERATRLGVEREVRSAYVDLGSAHRAVDLAERAAKFSRDHLDLAHEQFRLGAIRFTELQSVVDRAAQVERDALRARFAFAASLVLLEAKVGAPMRP